MLKCRGLEVCTATTRSTADACCRDDFENFLHSLADLHRLSELAIGADAAIWSHLDTTSNCSELIKGEFVIHHCFEERV